MNRYKQYESYKESDISWLGEIPKHWEVRSFKNILLERSEKNDPIKSTERLSLSIDKGVTLYSEKTTNLDRFKDDFTQYKLAHEGDLVLNSMNMIVGAVGVSKYFGCVSPVYYTYFGGTNNGNSTKFYEYLFRSKIVQGVLFSLGRGLIAIDRGEGKYNTLRLKVSRTDLRSLKLPLPPPDEQVQLVNFLDYKLAKINRFIRKKKQLIKMLNEQKAAIINQAITKGIDPNASMKNSGIDWLGEIPAHWEVKRLKFLAKICNGSDCEKKEIGAYPVYGSGGIFGRTDSFLYDKVSVLLGRKGTIDKPQFVDQPFWTVDTAFYTKIKEKEVIPLFFYHLCCNIPFGLYSSKTALPSMTQTSLYQVKMPVPPINEQLKVLSFLNDALANIDKTISTIEREITLTQEYKTALIADAVTGKIDVRDFVIPETTEEQESYEDPESYREEEELNMVAEDDASYQNEALEE